VIASERRCDTLEGGWSTYTPATARVIVGAGDEFHPKHQDWFMRMPAGGEDRRLLEPYQARSSGGELEVTLAMGEMPQHDHGSEYALNGQELPWGGGRYPVPTAATRSGSEYNWAEGADEAHNNMPPYIALYFCKKD